MRARKKINERCAPVTWVIACEFEIVLVDLLPCILQIGSQLCGLLQDRLLSGKAAEACHVEGVVIRVDNPDGSVSGSR